MFNEHMDLLKDIFIQLEYEKLNSHDKGINYSQFRELLEVHCYLVFNTD